MRCRTNKGFTLIELIMVIVIIGILAAIAIPTFANLVRQAKEGATRGGLGGMRSGLAIYYAKSASDPALAGNPEYPNNPAQLVFSGPVPRNQLITVEAAQTVIVTANAVPTDYVSDSAGFGFIPGTGADAGKSWAYVDSTNNLNEQPDKW